MIKDWFNKAFKRKIKKTVTGRDTRRAFTKTQRVMIWKSQKSRCNTCNKKLDLCTVVYDHRKRWADGGKTTFKNGQALCPNCNNLKNFNENATLAEKRVKHLTRGIK